MTATRGLLRKLLAVAIAALCAPGALVTAAQTQEGPRSVGPGRCGSVDPALSGPAAGDRDATLLLSATGAAGSDTGPLSFPVDQLIRRLVIIATFDGTGGTLDVVASDETAVEANEQIQDARTACGRSLVIDRPNGGVWQATPSASGRFSLRVHGVSDFDVAIAEFVENGAALAHSGSSRIAGQPVAGRPGTLGVSMSGPVMQSYEFALVSEQGRVIEPLTLTRVSELRWEGAINVPREPFRIAVSGEDQSEARFQRWSKVPFQPELVEVRAPSGVAEVQAGAESRLAFTIRNFGSETASFGVAASDERRFVTRVEPALLELAAGAEQQVTVWLKVPASAVAGRADQVTVTATSIGSRPTSNTAALRVGFRE